jgi:hypothetical protein
MPNDPMDFVEAELAKGTPRQFFDVFAICLVALAIIALAVAFALD